jgi:hypothetical protein
MTNPVLGADLHLKIAMNLLVVAIEEAALELERILELPGDYIDELWGRYFESDRWCNMKLFNCYQTSSLSEQYCILNYRYT